MIQITCVKNIFSNIFYEKQDKNLNGKRPFSKLDDEENFDILKKKQKIELNANIDENDNVIPKLVPPKEESRENDENMNELKDFELEAQSILIKFKGILINGFQIEGETYFKISCQIHHKFVMSLKELRKGHWCKRCDSLLQEAKVYAKTHQGELLNIYYEEFLSFLCVNQHIWKIHNKSWKNRWCSKCIHLNKEEEKKRHIEENNKKEQVLKNQQSKLFEEAKKKYTENETKPNYYPYYQQPIESKVMIMHCYKKIEEEAKNIARLQADVHIEKKLMQESLQKDFLLEQFINCFKILLIPTDVLKKYMECLSKEELKKEYREYVKIIHPDKNAFPQARTAFLKYHDAYESIMKLNFI